MTGSPLKKFILTPALLSAAVFATLTLPLAVFGSKPVTIQLQQEPVFQGQLRDVATPYLGLATVLNLGAGFASVAVTGWRMSTRKSSQVEAKLSDLEQNLKEKEALTHSQVEELHTQLQQVMAQMASVQAALSATKSTVTSEAQVPASSTQRQAVQSWSVKETAF